MRYEITARKWLASILLSVIWVAITCWLGMVHYWVALSCILLSIISVLLGFIFYLVLYGVLGYMTTKCMISWKQCGLLFLLQAVLVFGTACGSWISDTVLLFRPFALFYVEEPVRNLLHKITFDQFALQYGLAFVEMIGLQLLAIGVSKLVRKIWCPPNYRAS